MDKQTGRIVMRVLREHRPIPQNDAFFPDGSVVLHCYCSDITEYHYNGYSDHQTVMLMNALAMADTYEEAMKDVEWSSN